MDSCSASGMHSLPGGYTYNFSLQICPHTYFFLRPGGARAPIAPSGYACGRTETILPANNNKCFRRHTASSFNAVNTPHGALPYLVYHAGPPRWSKVGRRQVRLRRRRLPTVLFRYRLPTVLGRGPGTVQDRVEGRVLLGRWRLSNWSSAQKVQYFQLLH